MIKQGTQGGREDTEEMKNEDANLTADFRG
jgi:hypothetical protein